MRIKNYYSLALLSAMTVFGCSQNDLFEASQNPNNAISFSTQAGKHSRGAVLNNDNVKNFNFGVYAYYTGTDGWSSYSVSEDFSGKVPNFMADQTVKYNEVWEYTPVKYWPNDKDEKISFFAYMPKIETENTEKTGNAIIKGKEVIDGKLPVISFTQEVDDPNKMVDFTVAKMLDQTKTTGVVNLPFKHVLTRLNFMAKAVGTLASNSNIYIKDIKILGGSDSRFFKKGDYELKDDDHNGEWKTESSDLDDSNMSLTNIMNLTENKIGTNQTKINSNCINKTSNTELLKNGQYIFLIPPYGEAGVKSKNDIRFQIDYDIVTEDDKLPNGISHISSSQVVSMPNGSLVEGKAYNIVITLDLKEVKLSAELTEWDTDTEMNVFDSEMEVYSSTDINNAISSALKNGVSSFHLYYKGNDESGINITVPYVNSNLNMNLTLDLPNQTGNVTNIQNNKYTGTITINAPHATINKIVTEPVANCYMINPYSLSNLNNFVISFSQALEGWKLIDKYTNSGTTNQDVFKTLLNSGEWEIVTLWRTWDGEDKNISGTKISGETEYAKLDFSEISDVAHSWAVGQNAIVALKSKRSDDNGKIFWSWHLWFTDYNPYATGNTPMHGTIQGDDYGYSYTGASTKKMMDRNLGATIIGWNDNSLPNKNYEQYFGLLYQYGRKDPFIGGDGTNDTSESKFYTSTGSLNTVESLSPETENRLVGSIYNPDKIYIVSPSQLINNWYNYDIKNIWEDASKSPFDPSPAGWRVPKDGTWTNFGGEGQSSTIITGSFLFFPQIYEENNSINHRYHKTSDNKYIFYPAAGARTKDLHSVNLEGRYYTSSNFPNPSNERTYTFYFNHEYVNPQNADAKRAAYSVRAIQE